MPELKQFLLPDVGEGLTEADILSWAVAPGDTVVVNQTLVEVETAKAAVELPSPFAGVVREVHAAPGDTVEVGRPIITIDVAPGGEPTSLAQTDLVPTVADAGSGDRDEPATGANDRQAVLVGYGPRAGATTRRVRRPAATAQPVPTAQAAFTVEPQTPPAPAVGVATPTPLATADLTAGPVASPNPPAGPGGSERRVRAKPPVRKLAKALGVDLAAVRATGPNGSVSREDLQAAAEPRPSGPLDDGRSDARETRVPVRGVRKHTAAAMVASAFTAPHVTEFVRVDVTETMALRERIARRPEFVDLKVSPLLLVARALLWAVRRTPIVNSTWDEDAGDIVIKHYVNLGIAAATGRGLVVPNVKDAQTLDLRGLASALADLTATARAGRTLPSDMAGGTITITNIGVFGIDSGTPILNPGEAAILAVGSIQRRPWVVQRDGLEVIEPRWVTQLGLSFDHRVVDGEQGSIFLADVAALLGDPALAVL